MSKNEYSLENNKRRAASSMRPPGGFKGMAPGEKPKDFKTSIKKIMAYCKADMPVILLALFLSASASIFSLIGPGKLSDITDLITEGLFSTIDLDKVIRICLFLALLYGLGFLFSYLQGFIMASLSQKISKKLRSDIAKKINELPLSYFDQTSHGNTLSRVTNDVDVIGQTLNQSLPTLLNAMIMFLGSLVIMFYTQWLMALSALLATSLGFFLMTFIISKSQKYFMQQQSELGKINGHIEEIYAGHQIVKAYNGEKEAREVFASINERLYNSAWKSQFMSGVMMPLMNFIGNFGYVVVCIVGAVLAINGSISFGVIVAFMIYIRLFTQPLSQLAQAATNLQSTAAAGERVFEFLEEQSQADESHKTQVMKEVKGDVTFSHVHFGYTKDKTIINDFSAHIEAGQKVAIVGPTGAGKTTIVNLLMRFYELDQGEIKIDGVPISALTREDVHHLFCMVLQDTWLFEGTIKENIIYNKKGVTDQEVIKACKAVGLHHFIKTLPQGYDTVLNDKASLSAGQKQLITIARAMIDNAPLLILDEATSSVDTRTEILIQQAMDQLSAGRTAFIIAHRLSTIKNADLILVMKDGDIIESGNHETLLTKGGFYAELYNSQFEKVS